MAHLGAVVTESVLTSASSLLVYLQAEGFELQAHGGDLRIRPAGRVTPELREALARHKAELVAHLQPSDQFVSLLGGLVIPRGALELALDLERRGFKQSQDARGAYQVEPAVGLSEGDRARIARWRLHLGAIVAYEVPSCA